MAVLAACDPGLRYCGLSIWVDGRLVMGALIANENKTDRGPAAWLSMAQSVVAQYPLGLDVLVIEQQQMDRRAFNADDMFEVAGVTGAIVGCYDGAVKKVIGYKPRQWSRVPKEIRHERLKTSVTPEEWKVVEECPKALRHNLLDAIALGEYHLKRTGQR